MQAPARALDLQLALEPQGEGSQGSSISVVLTVVLWGMSLHSLNGSPS